MRTRSRLSTLRGADSTIAQLRRPLSRTRQAPPLAGFLSPETALAALAWWAMQDAGCRREQGVRGMAAYVTVAQPSLWIKGIERVLFLRETEAHVITLCDSAAGGPAIPAAAPRGRRWDGRAAQPPGGARPEASNRPSGLQQ
jgi:hypothetical protein